MAKNSVTLRLGSEGGEKVVEWLKRIGQTGSDELRKLPKEARDATRAFEAMERAVDPASKAAYDFARSVASVNRAVDAGVKTQAEGARVIDLAAHRYQIAMRAADQYTKGLNDNAKSAGLARHEWTNLSRQLQDVGTMLASGSSPMQVLATQGAQIYDVFSSARGGAGGALREFGATALRVALHPVTLIGAAAATAGLAMWRWKEQTDALTVSLNGLGRASGMTVSQVNSVAVRAAARGGMSGASGRALAGQFIQAGVPSGSLGGAISLTQDMARRLGMSFEDAASTIAQSLADPARGADELAKKFGLVTFAQREQIRQLAAVGDRSAASAKLLGILADQISRMSDPTARWQKLLDRLGAWFSDTADALGSRVERGLGLAPSFGDVRRNIIEAQRREREMRESQAQERAADLLRLREEGALAVREVQARTYAEREAIAMERARAAAMRATNDATKASIAAENERAKMLAESARKIEDLSRSSADNLRLATLSPYQRRMAEIDMAERDFRRENLPQATGPMATAFNAAGNAARTLADALTQSAGRIGRLIPLSDWQGSAGGDDLSRAREAIAAIESRGSGGYGAIGPRTRRGDRAYGRYQVMGENIPSWTRDALGRELTPQQFLADPAAQDAVFNRQFGRSMMRYGNMNDAASVWFTGRPLARGAGARDVLGTSGSEYVRRFSAHLGGAAAPAQSVANDNLGTQVGRAFDDQRAAARFEAVVKPLRDANAEIDRQRALLQAQAGAFGKSSEEAARAAKQQELVNQFQAQGVPITDALRASIAETAANYGRLVTEQQRMAESQRRLIDAMDTVRSMSRDALGGMVSDLMRGENAGKALENQLMRIADRIAQMAVDTAIEGIFGKAGSPNMGFGGGLLGGLLKLLPFEQGGVMTPGGPIPLRRYAAGGVARSPQLALYGEGRTPEAYVPLPDGRSIPVTMRGGARNDNGGHAVAAPVTVNLIGAPQGTEVRETVDKRGGRRIDVVMREQWAAAAGSPTGQEALRAGYGARPALTRR